MQLYYNHLCTNLYLGFENGKSMLFHTTVKFPLLRTQYKMFAHYFFDWKFVIKAPKYTEKDDLFLKLLFYLSSKDVIIKKKRYLFLLFPLSKDTLTTSTSWHLPKDIRAKKKATEFRSREK